MDEFDTGVAHPGRRYNYWLGGTDNFAADRASGDALEALYPKVRIGALANRALLRRAVRYLAADVGVRQFLDIGTGLPSADNTHEVAQRVDPAARVVYVDKDPLIMRHARALLPDGGSTVYFEADLNDPAAILGNPLLRQTLDLDRPVALMLIAVLHFIHGDDAAAPLVRQLMDALPPGSFLVATHATTDFGTPDQHESYRTLIRDGRSDVWARGHDEFAALFDGLDLIPPGVVPASEWRPDPGAEIPPRADVNVWTAVGRKP